MKLRQLITTLVVYLILMIPIASVSALTLVERDMIITQDAAVLSIETDTPVTPYIKYGDTIGLSNRLDAPGQNTRHTFSMPGLNPDSKYYYTVNIPYGGELYNFPTGSVYSFKTLDNIPPYKLPAPTKKAATTTSITIEWQVSSDTDTAYYNIYKNNVLISNTTKEIGRASCRERV